MKKPRHQRSVWLKTLITAVILLTIATLFTGCADPPPQQEGGGEVETPNVDGNPRVSSPITIVPPLLSCGESVSVRGFVSQARIRIYVNGGLRDSDIGLDPELHTVKLSSPLVRNDVVTATQEVDGFESGPSPEVRVMDHTEAYPSGLPQPNIPFQPLYHCGVATYVDNLPPGGRLTVFDQVNPGDPRNTIGGLNGVAAGQSIGVGPPFVQNHWVSAQSQICTDSSGFSPEQQVQPPPASIPAPQVTGLYENSQLITVNHLVNGAKVTLKDAGGSIIGGGGAPSDHVRFGLSRPLISGERVDITQELCPGMIGTGIGTVLACSALPAPRIAAPWAGDEVIHVIDPVPGSRIRIFSAGNEIGDGGGSEVRLIRPLIDGEELIVTQSLGVCTARMAWRVRVGRGLDDPTAFGPCREPEPFEYGDRNDGGRRTTDVSTYFNSPSTSVSVPMNAVPLHGVARVPRGDGPFPLVLIVHGNHDPTDPSYPGYDYLLDLLASHCMIAVSVEEDFLNGRVVGEMDARGIVLLRHLQLWREWSQTPGHRFFGKVDVNKIGLAGHSRGGEAIAAAHQLNTTDHRPADPLQNFGFNIKALYSIAPVDGQFGAPITLQGADYYSMHGSHDGDVFDFGGLRMYNRAYPVNNSTSNTKGFVFVHGANHGQWNSTWETCCEQGLAPLPFPLISSNDQKQIGKAYMSAFFQMSLKGNTGYKHFLNGDAGFASLPSAVRVFQYQDPQRTFIDHYQEDNDLITASLTGATNAASASFTNHNNLSFNQEDAPNFLWGDTYGLLLQWEGSSNPEYRVRVAGRLNAIPNYRYFAFHAGQTHEEPRRFNDPSANQDFNVQLVFGATAGPAVSVSNYALLRYPALTGPWADGRGRNFNTKKSILRTVRIPFADLRPDPRLRVRDVTEIVFRFNRRASGSIAIDEIQFTE
ncbi:MAG: hypothetical protein WBD16_07300 [Pyrinomonadaceae bacterium]